MPESREQLRAARRTPRATTAEIPEPVARGETVLMARTTDGMQASRMVLAPGATFRGPDPALGSGQYWISLPAERTPDLPWQQQVGVTFVGPDEPTRTLVADGGGAEMFVLQFPRARST
jgi:hypothetical protein